MYCIGRDKTISCAKALKIAQGKTKKKKKRKHNK